MLVFLSWSGEKSKIVAEGLEKWLAQVIQAVEPWVSADIGKGTRWGPEISERLEKSKVGIICLTKQNLDSKWILFESGALSKTKDAYVCTLLVDMEPSDVEQPLAQFQHTRPKKEDIYQLLRTINGAVQQTGEKSLAEDVLKQIFETYWSQLEDTFERAAKSQETTGDRTRPEREILDEILELLRNQDRRIGELATLSKATYRLGAMTTHGVKEEWADKLLFLLSVKGQEHLFEDKKNRDRLIEWLKGADQKNPESESTGESANE